MGDPRGASAGPTGIVVLGTGQMGCAIARLVVERPGLELVGAWARRPERAGLELGEAVGLGRPLGLAVESDLPGLLERARPRVAIQTTCSRVAEAEPEITRCLERGIHVVSIAEEMAWPEATSPEAADRLDRLARAHGAALLGTGVNPGFVLDLLVVTLSGACARVDSITATRVNDLSPYGPTVLRSQGVGLTPEGFEAGLESGEVVGHLGFRQSIAMIAAALGWEIERIEESREPIVAAEPRETPFVRVEPGRVAGCLHSAFAWRDGRRAISLIHPQQVCPEAAGVATRDTLEIAGDPPLRLTSHPEIPGGRATVALAVNAVPRVLAAAPGLRHGTELPPPAAMLGPRG